MDSMKAGLRDVIESLKLKSKKKTGVVCKPLPVGSFLKR